jgi:hypothetical protein
MTPSQIEATSRNKYNSLGDTFYSSAEIMDLITEACMQLATRALCIERVYQTTTIASTQEYSYPTNVISIKRVTYNGQKLKPITMREDDALTMLNQSTTATGTPQYYFNWNESVYLRPIPDAAQTLQIFGYAEAQPVTSTSALEVPTMFHPDIVNFVVAELCAKDENYKASDRYLERWEAALVKAERWAAKKKRGDAMAAVQDEETLGETILGST